MEKQIELYLERKAELAGELEQWVKDKSVPLDERWHVFFISNLGDHRVYLEEFKNMSTDDMVRKKDYNKYEVVNLNNFEEDDFDSKEKYDEFREDVLDQFVSSFEWDW